jgi:hypothetical protein
VRFPGFVGGTYQSESLVADAQRALNVIPELVESGAGKNRYRYQGRPGLVEFAELPTAPVRATWPGDERLFAVGGSKLYEVFSDGTYDERGDVGDDAGHTPAQILTNGLELFIVSAGGAYLDNGVTVASAPVPADPFALPGTPAEDVGTASVGAFMNGLFIAAKPDSKTFFYSAYRNGAEWSDLDRLIKEGYPDNIAQLMTSHTELWTIGDQTSEVWRNEGDPDNAFTPDPGAFIHQGIVAPYSAMRFDQGLAWLGGDTSGKCVAWRTVGFAPKRISTHAIESAWSGYSTVSDAVGFSFVWKGHTLLVFNFLTANKTWVYDLNTNLWHEWASGVNKFRGRCHAFTFGKHLVGDHTSGKIYQLSDSHYQDDGAAITYQRTAPYVAEEQHNLVFHDLKLEAEDLLPADVTLEWSTDGGDNWTTPITANDGLFWRRLGGGRDRIFRVTSTANKKQAWVDAYLRVTGGRH